MPDLPDRVDVTRFPCPACHRVLQDLYGILAPIAGDVEECPHCRALIEITSLRTLVTVRATPVPAASPSPAAALEGGTESS